MHLRLYTCESVNIEEERPFRLHPTFSNLKCAYIDDLEVLIPRIAHSSVVKAATNSAGLNSVDCDVHLQDITPLSAGSKSCSANSVSASPWVFGSNTSDLSAFVPGSGGTNPGERPASVVTVPSTRHRLDGAHSAPDDSCVHGQEETTI